jgi:PST family polysaccharide transporter
VIDVAKSVSGLGLGFSAVKDIAQASASNDETKIAETITVTRRLVWWTGTVGAMLMILFSGAISRFVFHDQDHILAICLLSFCVLTGLISSGQMALLQGTRQLLPMAKASVYSTLVGLVVALTLYVWLGINGIVPALIGISVVSLFFSWFFTRQIRKKRVKLSLNEVGKRGSAMIKLGMASMLSGLAATCVMLLIKRFILKETQQEEMVGLYQAVWSLSAMYISALLSAMSTDYFPRLCSLEHDEKAMVAFANQQARFVMLVSTPLIVLVLLLSPLILSLFYSRSFLPATDLMLFQLLGTFFKLAIWPVAFFLLAKGKGGRFLFTEISWYAVYYVATTLLWPHFGLLAAGIAYVLAYIVYCPLIILMVRPLCHLKLTSRNTSLLIFLTLMTISVFLSSYYLEGLPKWTVATVLSLSVTVVCLKELNAIVPFHDVINKLQQWRKR